MSMPNHPLDKKDRSVQARQHDQYKAKGKLQEPSVCRECQAVYHKGRWVWGAVPSDSQEVMCPACERIRDHAPCGVLLLTGEIVVRHRDQVLGLARNEEARLKAEYPLARIIRIEDQTEAPRGVVITTTDPHLARRIGEAVHNAYRGTLTCRYEENEDLPRANWEC